MCDETAMALVRVSAEDIANDLTTENALNILIGLLVVFHARKHMCTSSWSIECPLSCRPGCKCDKGYVRRNSNGGGPCVRRRHCKNHHKKGPKKGPKKHHKKGHKKD
ncbi:hypothetical protein SSS_10529 [Sarcoptes scabiei]|nr:hypothetical protein SSS_10529 [Sarcoptes scabiei]